jgi:hypothetical protein
MSNVHKSIGVIGIELLVNLVFPYAIYIKTEAHIGQAHGLMAASLPPIIWSVIEFIRSRRLDAMSLLVIAGIALSLLAFLGGGSVRLLQLRENLVTGIIALVFLGSAAIRRPLIYQLAQARNMRTSHSEAERFEKLRRESPQFRRSMTVMTLVWGFGLLAQTAISCCLVFAMPIADYLIVSPLLAYGSMGALALWTFWYVKRIKRRARAAHPSVGVGSSAIDWLPPPQ